MIDFDFSHLPSRGQTSGGAESLTLSTFKVHLGMRSDEIPVDLYHQILLCPFRIQPDDRQSPLSLDECVRELTSPPGYGHHGGSLTGVDTTSPENHSPNAAGDSSPEVLRLSSPQERKKTWEEQKGFPFGEGGGEEDPFSLSNSLMRLRYSEFAYFHPFVRKFLYGLDAGGANAPSPDVANRGGSRGATKSLGGSATEGAPGGMPKSGDVQSKRPRKAMRMLKRNDIRWAKILVNRFDEQNNRPESIAYLLRVRRVELYLFETLTGFLVVEFDSRLGPHASADLADYRWGQDIPLDTALGQNDQWEYSEAPKDVQSVPQRTLRLDDVIRLQDVLRRLYVPYWEPNAMPPDREGRTTPRGFLPGHSSLSLEWYSVEARRLEA